MRTFGVSVAILTSIGWSHSVVGKERLPGLEIMEGIDVVSLVDVQAQDRQGDSAAFGLHCWTKGRKLTASAPAAQLGPYAKAGPGEINVAGHSFAGTVVIRTENGSRLAEITVPLTKELLVAVSAASSARLLVGDGFAVSNDDRGNAFREFAKQCSRESQVQMRSASVPPPAGTR
jgi:hypothetical protein